MDFSFWTCTCSLGLLKSKEGLLAFASDVGLEAHVVWSGGIRVKWSTAIARAGTDQQLSANIYKLVLRVGDGESTKLLNIFTKFNSKWFVEPTFVMATNLSGDVSSYQFGGKDARYDHGQ